MIGVVVDKVSRKIIAIIHNPIRSSETEIIGTDSSVRGIDRIAADLHFYNEFDATMGDELPEGLIEVSPPDLTEIEQLQKKNQLLKAQNNALSERADFIEDIIAEMAMQVYQ